ncbi:MAG TPA: pitrilysin family protein [SAR202 cluster bacterium]|nr:pitrilysin family protein [SAR202 cluster bacterium]|tara:strand:+ start:24301 stop:26952 length:2652 start_codon:yes stop_codon:yes gene_type:complete
MISIPFQKHTLGNGLDIITHVDKTVPTVAVNIWYHVGSKNEIPGKTGFAHLFEHVMFEGSRNHNKDYFGPLQEIGATVNGSTTNDRTNYWENLPSNYLELALWLESDRMGFLLEALDQKRFDLQREVVKNERRQSYENRPYGMAYLKLQELLFPPPHPYNWPTIGSQEDLDGAEIEDVKEFFRNFYHPSNASISIAGDIDPNSTFDLIDKYFGNLSPGPAINRFHKMDSILKGQTWVTLEDSVHLPRLYLAWPTVPEFTQEQAALDVLSVIMADGRSSRLEQNLVYKKQLARDIRAYHHGQEISGEFHIIATANPGQTTGEIYKEIQALLDELSQTPPSDKEMERAYNIINSYHVRQLEKIGGFGGKADQLNHFNVMAGNPGLIETDVERYKKVSANDVSAAAKLLNGNFVGLTVNPLKDTKPSSRQLDRTNLPKVAALTTFSAPQPKDIFLENGTRLLVIERSELPLTTVGVFFDTGSAEDLEERPGIAQFATDMLFEGTQSRSSSQIADEMEFLGSHVTKDVSREHTFLAVSGISDNTNKELDVLSDIILNPNFPVTEMERIRKEKLSDLRSIQDSADATASVAMRSILLGPTTPYGHTINGDETSIAAMKTGDLEKHYHETLLTSKKTFIVVGNISSNLAAELITEKFRTFENRQKPQENQVASKPLAGEGPTIYLVDRPGSAQSILRAGHISIPREHQDYHSLAFVNYILGGDYSSRLNMNLRQDKGYSYGFHSSIEWMKPLSILVTRGSVQTEVTKESVFETLKELTDIVELNPIGLEEFRKAKEGLLKSVPSQFESNQQITNQLLNIAAFDLPLDYFETNIEKISDLTLDDVRQSAVKHILPAEIKMIVVGDKEKIQKNLEELGYPLFVIDMYGNNI